MSKATQLTHSDYLNKLKTLNIEVYPIDEYINNYTKITHKCVCGNKWEVRPNNVLFGHKCGCTRGITKTSSHQQYLNKLKKKDIEVYPLEDYISNKTKILHKCVCGNEWEAVPIGVLNGNKCGCAKRLNLRDEAFYKNKPTVLYYIQINNLYKIGVTLFKDDINKSLKKRFSTSKIDFTLLQAEVFID